MVSEINVKQGIIVWEAEGLEVKQSFLGSKKKNLSESSQIRSERLRMQSGLREETSSVSQATLEK